MKRVLRMICVLAVFLCLPFFVSAEDWGGLIYNGDFSDYSDGADMPAGWQLVCYDASLSDAWVSTDLSGPNCICLQSYGVNDVRACQDIEVDPDTTYLISGEICTEDVESGQGANLSVDNYSVDGTFCYTDPLLGTNDWTAVELFVHTGTSQDTLRIALRLGGYGKTSSGLAGFRNISVTETEYEGDEVIFLTESSSYGDASEQEAKNGLPAVIAASVITALLAILVYRFVTAYSPKEENGGCGRYGALALILASAFIVRLILSLIFFGHSTDINCFMAWGNAALNGGLSGFYTSGMFADYPPGYMYFCAAMSWLSRLLGFAYGSNGMAFLFKLPSTLADLLTALILYRLAKKNGLPERMSLILAALAAFDPVIAFVSGAWGQIESLLVLGIAASFYLLQEDKPIAAGAVYGLTVLLKPQALMFGPILAVSYFCAVRYAEKPLKQLLRTVIAVIAAFAVILAVSLPFRGGQKGLWLVDKYFSTSTSYPYASIEAFNFPAFLGDNWASVRDTVLGVPYTVWGPVMIGIGILLASAFHVCSYHMVSMKERSAKANEIRRGSLYLCAACMMAFLFTFGYYMHERYLLPVLLLLLIAFVYEKDRRILGAFFGFSVCTFLNATAAMYIVDHAELRGPLYEGITRCGGFLETLCCLYLIWLCIDILLFGHRKECRAGSGLMEAHDARPKPAQKPFGRNTDILHVEKADDARLMTRKDAVLACLLTLIYAVCALLNLGTLSAPETYWETDTPGEGLTVSFDGEYDVSYCLLYGNIAESGTLLFEGEDGQTELYEQTYDQMFRWDWIDLSLTTESLTVSLYAGSIKINEIAFFDENGAMLTPVITVASTDAEKMLDEQDTVPDTPSYFNGMYFDELYHARTAYEHLHNLMPYENSHPPLGKIIISLGIAMFGMNPFGWRIMGTLFGIAMLPVLYLFGKRMFKHTAYAFLATGLFAFDFMHYTQTRIATIDVYAVFFILLMYYFMYEYITMNFFTDGLKKTLRPLALCGVSFGLGCACKWISAYAGAGLAVLFFGSFFARWGEYASATRSAKDGMAESILMCLTGHAQDREATKRERTLASVFPRYALLTLAWCCLFFLLVPFAIYFLSYIPYFRYEASVLEDYTLKDAFSTFGRYQAFMFNYHSGLTATHPYQSSWWQWPFTLRPMWYYSGSDYENGIISTLTASGNPAVWWVSSIGVLILLIQRIRGRVSGNAALKTFCVGVLANYLPWVLVTRCTFIYHFFATVPFILLAAVYLLQETEKTYPGTKAVKWVWLGVAVLMFLLLYPGISGLPVDASWAAFIKMLPGGGLMYGA